MGSQVATYMSNDATVSFEIEPVAGFVPAASPDELVGRIRDALAPVVEAAQVVLDQVRAVSPDRVEVRLGVKVTGTMNWLIAKAASEGNFEITLSWEPGRTAAVADTYSSLR